MSLNQRSSGDDLWLFGYGSLIWKADFDYVEKAPAELPGWERRFWQGSHDHRGTPDKPGRVVTLIAVPQARCLGMAYRIAASQVPETLEHLDYREKNGYERLDAQVSFTAPLAEHGVTGVKALIYVATPDNFAHLGEATDLQIAQQICASCGPSGSNVEYLLELHRALERLGAKDPHVSALVDLVRQIG